MSRTHDGGMYIAMELVVGRDFSAYLKEIESHGGRLSVPKLMDLLGPIADTLEGRLLLESDPAAGRALLERALARDRITPCRDELACAVWTATKDLPAPRPTARIRRSRAAYVTVSALSVPPAIRPRAIAATR